MWLVINSFPAGLRTEDAIIFLHYRDMHFSSNIINVHCGMVMKGRHEAEKWIWQLSSNLFSAKCFKISPRPDPLLEFITSIRINSMLLGGQFTFSGQLSRLELWSAILFCIHHSIASQILRPGLDSFLTARLYSHQVVNWLFLLKWYKHKDLSEFSITKIYLHSFIY